MTIDGDLAYGRINRIATLTAPSSPDAPPEEVLAWGKPMALDTGYAARPGRDTAPTRLADLRAALIARYPQTGPIFA